MKTSFLEPTTVAEAASLLAQYGDDARVIAGGASLVLLLAHRMVTPAMLVSLGRVRGHDSIRREAEGLRLGALAHLRDVERSGAVRDFCPALARAYGVVGNVRVRNQGTVGGNLGEADYASDPPAMLLALDASVNATGAAGARGIPLGDFFLGFYSTALKPDEIMTSVFVPNLPLAARTSYLKFTSRSNEGRPSVAVAAVASLDDVGRCREIRVAVGAAIDIPRRLPEVEAKARGQRLDDGLIEAVAGEYAQQLEPIDDAVESAWYRREMIRVFVRRALAEVRDGHR